MSVSTTAAPPAVDGDELIDALLGASRVLVAVAARSVAGLVEDVTLAQYRVLIELAARGPQRVADLAAVLRWRARRPRECAVGWYTSTWFLAGE